MAVAGKSQVVVNISSRRLLISNEIPVTIVRGVKDARNVSSVISDWSDHQITEHTDNRVLLISRLVTIDDVLLNVENTQYLEPILYPGTICRTPVEDMSAAN